MLCIIPLSIGRVELASLGALPLEGGPKQVC